MPKEQVLNIVGKKNYQIHLVSQTPEGTLEILGLGFYSSEHPNDPEYVAHLLDGKLVEYHKYVLPCHSHIRDRHGEGRQ